MHAQTRAGRTACVCSSALIAARTACGGGGGGSEDDGPSPGVPNLEASLEFTAAIEGRITDGETGEPLEGITVELSALGVAVEDDTNDAASEEGEASDTAAEDDEEEAAFAAAGVPVPKARTGLATTTDETASGSST